MMQAPLVVGVDGSDSSLQAVDWAADEAARHAAPLRLVYASLWERYEGAVPTGGLERPAGRVLAENILAAAAERARLRVPALAVSTEVLAEDATSALLREGASASAVVVGSRGRGQLASVLLGSVSLVVAARSVCPVVVVRGDDVALASRHQRILLGWGAGTSRLLRCASPSVRRLLAAVPSAFSARGANRHRGPLNTRSSRAIRHTRRKRVPPRFSTRPLKDRPGSIRMSG